MASTYTSTIRLAKQGTGDNDGTWGVVVNNQLDLLDAAINGFKAVTVTDGLNTLSIANGSADDARYRVIHAVGALTTIATMVAPDVAGFKVIGNYTTGGKTLTYRTSSGTGVAIPSSTAMVTYSDGTTVLPLTSPMNKAQVTFSLTASNLIAVSASISTILTAANASITTLVATSLTTPNLVGTTGSFSGGLTVTATTSTGTLKATSAQIAGTVKVAIVSCNSIGVSAVDASRVSASSGYFGVLRGGTICVNAGVTLVSTPVVVSAAATSLSAGTGFAIGSLTYTPQTSTSRLLIQAYVPMACTTGDSVLYSGLFWNGSSTAIDGHNSYNAAISQVLQHSLVAELTPTTVGPITVSVRAAKSGLNTGSVNPGNTTTKILITEFNA